MPMCVKMGNGGTGFLGAPASSKRAMARRLRRREAKAGYPWEGKFETKEQVDQYFSGDKIECLLCGRTLKSLGVHTLKIHGVSEEKYRERFGLPMWRGLVCSETKGNYSEAIKSKPERIQHIKDLAAQYQHLTSGNRRRRFAPYVLKDMHKRLSAAV